VLGASLPVRAGAVDREKTFDFLFHREAEYSNEPAPFCSSRPDIHSLAHQNAGNSQENVILRIHQVGMEFCRGVVRVERLEFQNCQGIMRSAWCSHPSVCQRFLCSRVTVVGSMKRLRGRKDAICLYSILCNYRLCLHFSRLASRARAKFVVKSM
jgi:hypothetical protein